MTEEQWQEVADKVAVRKRSGEEFFDAVKNGLRDCSIYDYDRNAKHYCSEIGRRLGKRKRTRRTK